MTGVRAPSGTHLRKLLLGAGQKSGGALEAWATCPHGPRGHTPWALASSLPPTPPPLRSHCTAHIALFVPPELWQVGIRRPRSSETPWAVGSHSQVRLIPSPVSHQRWLERPTSALLPQSTRPARKAYSLGRRSTSHDAGSGRERESTQSQSEGWGSNSQLVPAAY